MKKKKLESLKKYEILDPVKTNQINGGYTTTYNCIRTQGTPCVQNGVVTSCRDSYNDICQSNDIGPEWQGPIFNPSPADLDRFISAASGLVPEDLSSFEIMPS